jgi:hypothetical protein
MKRYHLLLLSLLYIGCKKDNSTDTLLISPIVTIAKNTPTLIAPAYQPGIPFSLAAFHIYDLNHDDNKDKKYFRVEIYTDDSARIVMEPKPIDSLAANWPATIKKPRWSSGAEFVIDQNSFIQIAGNVFNQIQYNQASPQHAWLSQYKNTFPTPSSLPNAQFTFSNVYAPNFYFDLDATTGYVDSYNSATNNYTTFSLQSLPFFGQAFAPYTWGNVTGMIRLPNAFGSPMFFFDFKNWVFWKISKPNGALFDYVGGPVKSLDKFVKWPEGWGKK